MDLRLVKLLVSKSPDRRIESREVEPREFSVCQLWLVLKQEIRANVAQIAASSRPTRECVSAVV